MPGTSPPDDFPAPQPTPSQPPPQVGSLWWYRSESACGVVARASAKSVELRILNLPKVRRRVPLDEFYALWHRTPRMHTYWYNRGSLWKRINRNQNGKVTLGRQLYELDGIDDGGYTAWRGDLRPTASRLGLGGVTSFDLASNYVRVWEDPWPDQPMPHSESEYVRESSRTRWPPTQTFQKAKKKAPKKRASKPVKKTKEKPSVFDRLSGEEDII